MQQDELKRWPGVGEILIHRFRKREGEVKATVISVDRQSGKVAVKIGSDIFPTLSAAAVAVGDSNSNGWVYWGLKKQVPLKRRHSQNKT